MREKLDKLLAKDSAIKASDRRFELYKQFGDMYQRGLQYQPGSAKNVMNEILLEAGGDAEKAMMSRIGLRKGLFDKMTVNVTPEQNFSKTAKNYQNVLKEVNYEPDYKDLIDKLSKMKMLTAVWQVWRTGQKTSWLRRRERVSSGGNNWKAAERQRVRFWTISLGG